MDLTYGDLVLVLRALYWYEDKLGNIDIEMRDQQEFDMVIDLRQRLNRDLEVLSFIDR